MFKKTIQYTNSENIKERQVDNNYSVLALEYVLILYYLDKENYSYIVHQQTILRNILLNLFIDSVI